MLAHPAGGYLALGKVGRPAASTRPVGESPIVTFESIAADVERFLEQHRAEIIADTQRIISFRTVSGGSSSEQADYEREIPACFDWLRTRAEAMGFAFCVVAGKVGEIAWDHADEKAPLVGIASHIDVVTAAGDWSHPPFEGKIVDGVLYGRGAQDDKGPLVQALWGLFALKSLGVQLPVSVRIIIGTQEETGEWSDIDAYLAERRAPDMGFTPDADFPIINGEKGMLSASVTGTWDGDGIDEETGLEFVSLVGGERDNIVPPLCELTLRFPGEARSAVMKEIVRSTTEFVVENPQANTTLQPNKERDLPGGRHEAVVSFLGRRAHASTPDKGHNAILDATKFIRDIETFPVGVRQFGAYMNIAGSALNGANMGFDINHEAMGETSVCLALIEITPTRGRGILNIRPTMGYTAEQALDLVRQSAGAFTEATGLILEVAAKGMTMDPIYMDPDSPAMAPFVRSMRRAFACVTGKEAGLVSVGGTTYAKAFPNTCAFGPTLDEPDTIHQPDERVPVDAILRNTRIYGLTIAALVEELRA